MTLLLSRDALLTRRAVARGALAGLADSLLRELEPLLAGSHAVPTAKALLSRTGGRCACDGGLLDYDPFDARHRCPRCGREWTGEHHDRFRLYWHQLWLAERVVHAAVLGVLLDDPRCIATSADLLDAYAAQYQLYPNVDNVLGPTRPFFSTYLESIWLLQLAIALDLLETGAPSPAIAALGGRVRERLIGPSAALIASYDEGMSNRQVWNNAALLAAGTLLDDAAMYERALTGPSGLHAHLAQSLLGDGSWYEGENYHLFAHRGLWYGVQIAETAGHPLPPELTGRFEAGFVSPFRTLLPDLTYPSRRDSQYAVSVRQPRFAESCELGLARGGDDRLLGMLARLYDPSVPRGETGRARSSADVERNLPATGLTRADLSWRTLLMARETLPAIEPPPLRSDLLPAQGFGILRRDNGTLFVGLDYGHSGGGHGHPDRLSLLLSDGARRWFNDPGTGSYVEETLHWYRSTLAHTAPLVDGRSQPRVHGELVAYEDANTAAWMSAHAELAPGLSVVRTVVLLDDYLVDLLQWEGELSHELALPLHGLDLVDADDIPLAREAAPMSGGAAAEDGFSFLCDTARILSVTSGVLRVLGGDAAYRLRGLIAFQEGTSWWSAQAPGVPGSSGRSSLVLARCTAPSGSFISVWSWRDSVAGLAVGMDSLAVTRSDGGRDVHAAVPGGWRISRERPDSAGTHIVLGGLVPPSRTDRSSEPRSVPRRDASVPSRALPFSAVLGESHYRRSEQSWREAGEPRAQVELRLAAARTLRIEVEISPSRRLFRAIDAENPYDNEPMAINGDGVQLYLAAGEAKGAGLLVPAGAGTVAVRQIEGWGSQLAPSATWRPTATGYAMAIEVTLPAGAPELSVDLIVNETVPGRERRRGQLVLSGAAGEFVYLRGDRHEPGRLLRFSLADV
jgi:hypothetical protein